MKRRKGTVANQFGRFVWIPSERQGIDAPYSARITRKGCSVKVTGEDKDKLVSDITELLEKLTPLATNGVDDAPED